MSRPDEDDGYPFDAEDNEESPRCSACGCDLETEFHDWDCPYAGDDDEVEEGASNCDSPYHPGCKQCEVKS